MRYTISLKRNRDFVRLYHSGKSAASRELALYCRKNRTSENRLGITVSSKIGNAVTRNRVRRRIKEAYRLNESLFRQGFDIVVVARSRSAQSGFESLLAALLSSAGRCGLLLK